METHAGALQAVNIRLDNHDQRLIANHDSIATLRDKSADHETRISVISTELRETREDIQEMRDLIRKELAWVRRGLWVAAGTFLAFFIAALTLALQMAGG